MRSDQQFLDETTGRRARLPSWPSRKVGLALIAATTAFGAAAEAQAAPSCQAIPVGVRGQNASATRTVRRLIGNTSYTPRIKTFTPRIVSTRGFDGYETIALTAPKGTRAVVGSFVLRGFEPCSVIVSSAGVVRARNAYLVTLKFPGEQGNPGRITITLISR